MVVPELRHRHRQIFLASVQERNGLGTLTRTLPEHIQLKPRHPRRNNHNLTPFRRMLEVVETEIRVWSDGHKSRKNYARYQEDDGSVKRIMGPARISTYFKN